MNLFNLVFFVIYIEFVLSGNNQCGEVFTDTTGYIRAHFQDYSASCQWTIIARQNELVIAKISTANTPALPNVLRVSHAVGSLSSTEPINETQATLWIRGGKVVLSVQYDFDFCNAKFCNVENYRINVTYEIVPLKTTGCEETIRVRNSQVVRLPHKPVSLWESENVGCNVILLAGNQTLKAELIVDLPERKSVSLSVYDGKVLLLSNEYSKFRKMLYPKQNSLHVKYRFRQPVIFANRIRLELVVVNSDLDCEFKNSTCEWRTRRGHWNISKVVFESAESTVLSLKKSGIIGNYSELDSPNIRTRDQPLCSKMSYWLNGSPGNALYALLVQPNDTASLWVSEYENSDDGLQEAQFVIPKHSEGFVRLLEVEGRRSATDELLNIYHVRSWWGRCDEKNLGEVEFFQDLTGTELFYKENGLYRANLPLLGSVARLRSKVMRAIRDYCLEFYYDGTAQLSVTVFANNTVLERRSFSFGSRSRFSQISLNKSRNIQITIKATNVQNDESNFVLKGVKLIPERCSIDCDFKTGTCSWWTKNVTSTSVREEDGLIMRHDSSNFTVNEITSTLVFESKNWFCLKFKIGYFPALCIQVGAYLFDAEGSQMIGEEILMTQCGATLNYTTQCVSLYRQQRPLQIFVRTTSTGHQSNIHNENVIISSVWTASDCPEPSFNCGWSQPFNSTVDASAFWNVIDKETGPVLQSQRSCCGKDTGEEAVVWSPGFVANNGSSKMCVTFLYSGQMRCSSKERTCVSSLQNSSVISLLLDRPTNKIWKKVLPRKAKGETYRVSVTLRLEENYTHRIGFSSILSEMRVEIGNLTATDGDCAASNHDCDFDNGLCDWSKEGDDFYSWTWTNSGEYNRTHTGPFVDCSLTRGGFVFADSDLEGKDAHLTSPDLPVNLGCVGFCYHMRGVGVGKLEVRLVGKEGGNETLLWSKAGNQGFPWHHVLIPLESYEGGHLKFTARKGGTFGDIAIDSVLFSENTRCDKLDRIVNVPLKFQ